MRHAGSHAELLRQLESAEVSDVVSDVDFLTSGRRFNQGFLEALLRRRIVMLPFLSSSTERGTTYFNSQLSHFLEQAWRRRQVSIAPDGLVRRLHFRPGDRRESICPRWARCGRPNSMPSARPFLIDFGIRHATIPRVSFSTCLNGARRIGQDSRARRV